MEIPGKINAFLRAWWKYLVAGAVLAAGGAYVVLGGASSSGTTLSVTRSDFPEQIAVSGTVIAAQSADLGFAANGRISGTYAKVGDHVYAGQLLAQIENGDLAAAVAQKKAALAEAQAKLASLEAGTRPEELAVSQAAVANAQASLADAVQSAYTTADDAVHNRADVIFTNPRVDPKLSFLVPDAALKAQVESDRAALEPMLAAWQASQSSLSAGTAATAAVTAAQNLSKVITLLADANQAINTAVPDPSTSAATLASDAATLATARTNVNAALATLTNDGTALDSAQKNLALEEAGSTAQDIEAQQAAVASAQADVENAQAALAKTLVVAPFSGTVTRMDSKVGEIVSPNISEISLQSDGTFEVETYVPELSISGVTVGDSASTTLDAYGTGAVFPSKVVSVDPAETVKDGVPTYKTTLAFLAPDPRIRSGMTANVTIVTGTLSNAVVIPAGAVGKNGATSYVTLVNGKKRENRTVETGIAPALGEIQITAGLSGGETILATPAP